MTEGYEVEIKIPVLDIETLRKHIDEQGYIPVRIEHQIDFYYGHPCRDFSCTDEALRIRNLTIEYLTATESPVSDGVELTYKGPKIDSLSKTRVELTTTVDDVNSTIAILNCLGFVNAGIVRKTRTVYHVDTVELCIDEVEGLGFFVELESIVEDATQIPVLRDHLLAFASELGLDTNTSIRKSYLEMLLEK